MNIGAIEDFIVDRDNDLTDAAIEMSGAGTYDDPYFFTRAIFIGPQGNCSSLYGVLGDFTIQTQNTLFLCRKDDPTNMYCFAPVNSNQYIIAQIRQQDLVANMGYLDLDVRNGNIGREVSVSDMYTTAIGILTQIKASSPNVNGINLHLACFSLENISVGEADIIG